MQRKEEKKTNLFSLEGKNAVVTGCATGIGQGLAVGLAKAGAKILAFDIADLSETKQKVEEVGGECQLYHVDLSNSAMIDEVWHLAVEENQHIDILFNNAGMQHRESVMTYPEDVFDRVTAVNLKSVFNTCRIFTPDMTSEGFGRIVNISSVWGEYGGSTETLYSAAKAGVIGFTKALNAELATGGVIVNSVSPGFINTAMNSELSEADVAAFLQSVSVGRAGGAEEVADVVELLTREKLYVAGANISVNGGIL